MDYNNNHPDKSRVELHKKDYHKKWHVLIWLIVIAFFLAVVCSAYIYFKTKNAVDTTYDNSNQVQVKKVNLTVEKSLRFC